MTLLPYDMLLMWSFSVISINDYIWDFASFLRELFLRNHFQQPAIFYVLKTKADFLIFHLCFFFVVFFDLRGYFSAFQFVFCSSLFVPFSYFCSIMLMFSIVTFCLYSDFRSLVPFVLFILLLQTG